MVAHMYPNNCLECNAALQRRNYSKHVVYKNCPSCNINYVITKATLEISRQISWLERSILGYDSYTEASRRKIDIKLRKAGILVDAHVIAWRKRLSILNAIAISAQRAKGRPPRVPVNFEILPRKTQMVFRSKMRRLGWLHDAHVLLRDRVAAEHQKIQRKPSQTTRIIKKTAPVEKPKPASPRGRKPAVPEWALPNDKELAGLSAERRKARNAIEDLRLNRELEMDLW